MPEEFEQSPVNESVWAFWCPVLAGVAIALWTNVTTSLNSDLGWILDFGRRAVEQGTLHQLNGSSFIEPNHPVVMHEWVACIAFFLAHRSWGAPGLIALKTVVMALTVVGIGAAIRSVTRSVGVALVVLALAAVSLHISFALLRPQLFAWLFLSVVVAAGLSGRRRWLWCTLPVVVVWANTHGSVLAGVGILAVLCLGALIEQRWNGESARVPPRELTAIPILGTLALLLNPWGTGLLTHTWHHATDPIRLLNAEWVSPLRAGPWAPFERDTIVAYGVVTLLALVLVPFRRVRLWGLLLVAIVSGLSAQRHLRMSPILMSPMAAAILEAVAARIRPRFAGRPVERWSLGAAAAVAFAAGAMWLGSFADAFELHDRANMSIGNPLWVIRANGLHGRIWNDFNWGGTLLWALPESQVACDGRNVTAYSSDTLRRNILLADEPDPLKVVEQSGAELVLLPTNDPSLKALRSKYAQLFCDNVACLLSSKPEFIARAKAGLILPQAPVPATAFFTLPGRPFLDLKPEAPGTAARQ